jgi:salicylate hydroxylase
LDGLFVVYLEALTKYTDQGQGGGQAIEDGAAIGALLSNITTLEDLPKRLQMFQDVRRSRASAIQIFSNAGQDEAAKIIKDAQPYVTGRVPSTQLYS